MELINAIIDVIRMIIFFMLFLRVSIAWVSEKPVTNHWIVTTLMVMMLLFKV